MKRKNKKIKCEIRVKNKPAGKDTAQNRQD